MLSLYDLTCEHRKSPIGLPTESPRFSWKLRSDKEACQQTSYRLSIDRMLPEGASPAWDSGETESAQSVLVGCDLPFLAPYAAYRWTVTVTDSHGESAEAQGTFETGPADWSETTARFISGDDAESHQAEARPSPLLRKAFTIDRPVRSARLYATAQGVYEMVLNGHRVGDAWMAPGWTSYNRRLQVQAHDVTGLVMPGENVLGASLGNGWFCGNLAWGGNRNVYGTDRALLAELRLVFADGTEAVVATDGSWACHDGPTRFSEIYHGETYDARLVPTGWDNAGYDDTAWRPVREVTPAVTRLVPQETEPVRIHEMLPPVTCITTPEGDRVLDFGQNITGFVRFTVTGPAGSTLVLHHAEVLDAAGNFYTDNMRSARNELTYTLAGGGPETWNPHFSFQGFRYVRVRAEGLSWEPAQFTACVLHTAMRQLHLSARAYHRVLKVGRTIADLDSADLIDTPHIAEALQYRKREGD